MRRKQSARALPASRRGCGGCGELAMRADNQSCATYAATQWAGSAAAVECEARLRGALFSRRRRRAHQRKHTQTNTLCSFRKQPSKRPPLCVCVCSRSSVCLCVCVCDLLMIQIRKTDRRANERTNGRRMCAVAATLYAALCGRQLCAPERFQPARARLWPLGRLPSRGWPLAKLASQKSKRAQR